MEAHAIMCWFIWLQSGVWFWT